jgi:hypothetical protein
VVEVISVIEQHGAQSCAGAWAEPFSGNLSPKVCRRPPKKSRATAFWTTMSSLRRTCVSGMARLGVAPAFHLCFLLAGLGTTIRTAGSFSRQ